MDIKDYENLYQISNCGRVKSKPRIKRNNGGVVLLKPRLLKQRPNSKGYYRVGLTDERGETKQVFVHRLVAYHFVTNLNPETNNVVNHLDCNPTNNKAINLEWTTIRGNMEHAVSNGRMRHNSEWKKHMREANEKNGKRVVGENIKTGEKVQFVCLNDCKAEGFAPSCVCSCCKGIRKTHKGYRWKYEQAQEN